MKKAPDRTKKQVKTIQTQVKQIEEKGKTLFRFVGSSEKMDRTGDIVETSGWDLANFKNNPVVLWSHNSGIPPIGKAVRVIRRSKDKQLIFDIEFPEKGTHEVADVVRGLVEQGFVKAVSVGFIPKDGTPIEDEDLPEHLQEENRSFWGPQPTRFTKQELLELSIVGIPAHQDALSEDETKSLDGYSSGIKDLLSSLDKLKVGKSKDDEGTKDDVVDADPDEIIEFDLDDKPKDDEGVKSVLQTNVNKVVFSKDEFESEECVNEWLKDNKYVVGKVTETDMFFEVVQNDKSLFVEDTLEHNTIDDGVIVRAGELKDKSHVAAESMITATNALVKALEDLPTTIADAIGKPKDDKTLPKSEDESSLDEKAEELLTQAFAGLKSIVDKE